ncbi:MAG TPA: hypothetical protein VK158_06435 [Acidobacteriota bacterium]|nr:hypothetical protein [Acidobacteriota bacterium]
MEQNTTDSPATFYTVIKINFIILLVVVAALLIMEVANGVSSQEPGLGFAIAMMAYSICCFALNLIQALIFFLLQKKNAAKGCLFSAFVVTLVSIGACFGGASILGML